MELDGEWVELIIEAKNMGMKLEDVLDFFGKITKDGTQETVNDRA
ncbi:DNA-binding anti-repressor SinI [Bacillus timonensis]|uniref:DNA-binding anti-repressor SinI n=1 Tax=Bacillus timonensis TaxID=1033734 RepID=A0A4S3PNB0_9BACI|nr:DNA-binding anti-repressor SinI [Bacillus timonensis]